MKRTATSPLQSPRAFAHPRLFTSPRDEVIESSQACEIEVCCCSIQCTSECSDTTVQLQMPSFYQPRIRNTLIQDESIFDFGSSPPRRPSPPRRIQLSSDTEPDDGSSDSEENSVDVHEALFSYCTTGPAPPSPTPLQQGSQTESETEDESQIQVTEPQLAVEGPQMESMTEDESPQPIDILERSDSQCGASLAAILQGFDRDWESFQKIAFAQVSTHGSWLVPPYLLFTGNVNSANSTFEPD